MSNEDVADVLARARPCDGEPVQSRHACRRRKQILLIAGRNLLLEKEQHWYSDFQRRSGWISTQRRAAARASNHVMFRDTDPGVRYLVKQGDDARRERHADDEDEGAGDGHGDRSDVRLSAADPRHQLPQLRFPGQRTASSRCCSRGVFAAGNIQKPKLGHTPFDGSIDFFGIAVPGDDKIFDASGAQTRVARDGYPGVDRRQPGLSVHAVPESDGRRTSSRINKYFAALDADRRFVVPSSTVTHGVGAGYEFKRRGYRFERRCVDVASDDVGAVGRSRRRSIQRQQTYRLYSVGASKDFLVAPFQSDPRRRRVARRQPSRSVQHVSVRAVRRRPHARRAGGRACGFRRWCSRAGRTRSTSSTSTASISSSTRRSAATRWTPTTWRPVTGTGIAVKFRAPWNTMFKIDVGKSFLPAALPQAGSLVLQIMLLKPL